MGSIKEKRRNNTVREGWTNERTGSIKEKQMDNNDKEGLPYEVMDMEKGLGKISLIWFCDNEGRDLEEKGEEGWQIDLDVISG